jgi:excisionase family DNA binding protein
MVIVTTEELLTTAEVCEILKIGRTTLYRWGLDGALRPVRLPKGTLRYRRSEVEALIGREQSA